MFTNVQHTFSEEDIFITTVLSLTTAGVINDKTLDSIKEMDNVRALQK